LHVFLPVAAGIPTPGPLVRRRVGVKGMGARGALHVFLPVAAGIPTPGPLVRRRVGVKGMA